MARAIYRYDLHSAKVTHSMAPMKFIADTIVDKRLTWFRLLGHRGIGVHTVYSCGRYCLLVFAETMETESCEVTQFKVSHFVHNQLENYRA